MGSGLVVEGNGHLGAPRHSCRAEQVVFDSQPGLGNVVARSQPGADLSASDRDECVAGLRGWWCVNSKDGHRRTTPKPVGYGASPHQGNAWPHAREPADNRVVDLDVMRLPRIQAADNDI